MTTTTTIPTIAFARANQAAHRRAVDAGRDALHQHQRRHDQPAHGELPTGQRHGPDAVRASPQLGQGDPDSHGHRAHEPGREADGVEGGIRSEHDESDAGCADQPP